MLRYLFILLLFIPCISYGAGTGAVNDPYTTLAELASVDCNNTVYLKDGTYSDTNLSISNKACTSSTPIIFRCSNGTIESKGECIFHSSPILLSNVHFMTITGMKFTNDDGGGGHPYIGIEGASTYTTITDNEFDGTADSYAIRIGLTSSNNQYTTISRNLFTGEQSYIVHIRYDSSGGISGNTNTTITQNAFVDVTATAGTGIIQVGLGQAWTDNESNYTEITKNLFQNVNANNTLNELFEIKTGSNKINYNTFYEVGGNISLRVGNNNEVIGNIWSKPTTNGGSYFGGIRISGTGHKVINNYLEGFESTCNGADYSFMAINVYWGGELCATSGFPAVNNVLIANNTIKNSCRGYGMFQFSGDGSCPTAPANVTYLNNLGESNVTNPNYEMFGGGTLSTTDNTWTSNRGHTHGQVLADATIPEGGVTDSGDFELTLAKTGLPLNWYYPSSYTNGTYNANVTHDVQGKFRGNPPDIGCDESGGRDRIIAVGPTWTGSYTIQDTSPEPPSATIGSGAAVAIGSGCVATIN